METDWNADVSTIADNEKILDACYYVTVPVGEKKASWTCVAAELSKSINSVKHVCNEQTSSNMSRNFRIKTLSH